MPTNKSTPSSSPFTAIRSLSNRGLPHATEASWATPMSSSRPATLQLRRQIQTRESMASARPLSHLLSRQANIPTNMISITEGQFSRGATAFSVHHFSCAAGQQERIVPFSNESVNEGHSDKIRDQVSDTLLDTCMAIDPKCKFACAIAPRQHDHRCRCQMHHCNIRLREIGS